MKNINTIIIVAMVCWTPAPVDGADADNSIAEIVMMLACFVSERVSGK